jgi:hypothetical protein
MRNTTHRLTLNPLVFALALVLAAAALPASAAEEGFPALAEHYEAIRQSLLHDSMDGVSRHGSQLAAAARSLDRDFTPAKAGVPAANAGEARELLGRVAAAADGIGRAKDLESARDAFTTLSERMISLAGLAGADLSVGYCPMAKASWLQPDGKVGNPYMGQKMATCGTLEKVGEETAQAGGRK